MQAMSVSTRAEPEPPAAFRTAMEVLRQRYLRRDGNGALIETARRHVRARRRGGGPTGWTHTAMMSATGKRAFTNGYAGLSFCPIRRQSEAYVLRYSAEEKLNMFRAVMFKRKRPTEKRHENRS